MSEFICDTCGQPATQVAFDYFARDNISTGIRESKPTGESKYGCEEHSVYPDEIDLGWNFNPFTGEVHEEW